VLQIPSEPRLPEPLDPASCLAEIEVLDSPADLPAGSARVVRTRVWNRGAGTWPTHRKVKLGNHWAIDGTMAAQDDGRCDLPVAVAPGESVDLDLIITAPATPGTYELQLDFVQELVNWWADLGSPTATVPVVVTPAVAKPTATPAAAESTAPPAESNSLSGIEMHGLHSTLVRSMVDHTGSHVALMVADSLAGEEWESYTYVIKRGD
jgi:hypothetical protein